MKTLGDFIPEANLPQGPGTPVAESPAMLYYTVVIAEGALSFYFFNYITRQHIPLADIPMGKLEFLCDRFVEYLDSAAEQEDTC